MPILPNTTQIPHIIIREWMPLLRDIELRILLVVADQTLGWVEDIESGRRKERDWISHYQLRKRIKKRGSKVCGDRSVSKALAVLVDDLGIIEAMEEDGTLLDSPNKRMMNGGKIYYRLNLYPPQLSLFDTLAQKTGVQYHTLLKAQPPHKRTPPQKHELQKKPIIQKNKDVNADALHVEQEKKRKEDHMRFMDYWYILVKKTRGINPVIGPSDGKNLKRILQTGIPVDKLEQIALFFLADYDFKKMSPTISTLSSSGILTGLFNRLKNDKDFWKKMDMYMATYFTIKKGPTLPTISMVTSETQEWKDRLSIKKTLTTLITRLYEKQ